MALFTVGLTGNIASGKSAVAGIWREMGITVTDADELARRAVAPGSEGLDAVVEAWGHGVLDAHGGLDRAALRRIVFEDENARRRLEAIVHPVVRRLRAAEHRAAETRGEHLIADDIPLIFEVGMQNEFERIVLVDAPEPVRHDRLVRLRGIDPAEAGRMTRAQMPAERKREGADVVIDNTGTLAALELRARKVGESLLRAAGP